MCKRIRVVCAAFYTSYSECFVVVLVKLLQFVFMCFIHSLLNLDINIRKYTV